MTLLRRLVLLKDENVTVSSSDTTPGRLENKLAPGLGMGSAVLDPTGNESFKVGLQATSGVGKAMQTSGLLGKPYVAFDGVHWWGIPVQSGSYPDFNSGYVRFLTDGTFLENVPTFGDNRNTNCLVYESSLDRIITARLSTGTTTLYFEALSKATPSVKTTGTTVSSVNECYKMIVGGGFIWAHIVDGSYAGALYKIPVDLSANSLAQNIDENSRLLMFDNTTTRYGDGEGRVFWSTTSHSSISRAIPSTDVVDDTFSPIVVSGEIHCACIDETNGRIWAAWVDDGTYYIGSFDCEPLGSNLRSLALSGDLGIFDITYLSSWGAVARCAGTPLLVRVYTDSGSSIDPHPFYSGTAAVTGQSVAPGLSPSYWIAGDAPNVHFGYNGGGALGGLYAVDPYVRVDYTPVIAQWLENDKLVRVNSADMISGYLYNKLITTGSSVCFEATPNNNQLRAYVVTTRSSLSLLAGSNDDIYPSDQDAFIRSMVIRLDAAGIADLTGLMPQNDGNGPQIKRLFNISSYDITIKHESVSSTDSFRFLVTGSTDLVLEPNDSADIWYDDVTTRWRVC